MNPSNEYLMILRNTDWDEGLSADEVSGLVERYTAWIEKMQAMGTTDVWRRDATRLGPNRGPGYSLVFLDPPYHKGLGEAALASAIEGGWLAPGAVIVWEEGTPPHPPDGFTRLDQRKYGDTLVTLLKAPE